MTMTPGHTLLRRWWRSALVGTLGGILAYGASFAVNDTYASSTRLLIRGREASFLTDTAQNVSNQPGIVDSSFAKTLGATQAGLVTSREMAETLVDRLGLDRAAVKDQGFLTRTLRSGLVMYAKGKAYLKHGFYKKPSRREQAISDVAAGLSAQTLENSYVLEIVATAETPEGARDLADGAAEQLISLSRDRAKSDADRYAASLRAELDAAEQQSQEAAGAIGRLKTELGIADIDTELNLDVTTKAKLREDVARNNVAMAGTQAELQSLERSLAAVKPTQQGEQTIKTGRSETKIVSNEPSSLYQQLLQQRDTAKARLAQLTAEQQALQTQLGGSESIGLNSDQAELVHAQEELMIAQAQRADLAKRYSEAKATAERPGVELTRIDAASVPNYPVGPKRYLYLGLGLILGALAGWGLSALAGSGSAAPPRRVGSTPDGSSGDDTGDDTGDDDYLDEDEPPTQSPYSNGSRHLIDLVDESVGATSGRSSRNGTGHP
jgi:uncharacterized protein involved in exopolysaccharide biosynthesis